MFKIKHVPLLCLGVVFIIKAALPEFEKYNSYYFVLLSVLIIASLTVFAYLYFGKKLQHSQKIISGIAVAGSILLFIYQYFK